MWLPLPQRRPEHAQVSVGIIGKPAEAQKRQKVPEEAARGNPDQDGPGQKLRTFPTVRERRRGQERRSESKETLESGVQSYEFSREKLLIVLCGQQEGGSPCGREVVGALRRGVK